MSCQANGQSRSPCGHEDAEASARDLDGHMVIHGYSSPNKKSRLFTRKLSRNHLNIHIPQIPSYSSWSLTRSMCVHHYGTAALTDRLFHCLSLPAICKGGSPACLAMSAMDARERYMATVLLPAHMGQCSIEVSENNGAVSKAESVTSCYEC